MLKSDLKLSALTLELKNYINSYLSYFISPLLYDEENKSTSKTRFYYREKEQSIKTYYNNGKRDDGRKEFVAYIIPQQELLNDIKRLFQYDNEIIFSVEKSNVLSLIETICKWIKEIFMATSIDITTINDFFKYSLELCIYLGSIQTNINTYKKISELFHYSEGSFAIHFYKENNISFDIEQIYIVISYVKAFIDLLNQYSDILFQSTLIQVHLNCIKWPKLC